MKTFPVLNMLPDGAFLCVLQNMEIYDKLAYSLCSNKSKQTIKSLNLKAFDITCSIARSIELSIIFKNSGSFCCFIDCDANFPNNKIMAHEKIEVSVKKHAEARIKSEWAFQNFEFKEWLHHFCEILHHPRIDELAFKNVGVNHAIIIPLQKAIGGLQIGCLSVCNESTEFTNKALESFPNYEELYIELSPFESHRGYPTEKFMIQNLKSLCIEQTEEINIDRVMLSNSEKIELKFSIFTEKELNKLLKLWIRGSNPRMKYFYTTGEPEDGSRSFDENVILKRIKYQQVSLNSEEVYRELLFKDAHIETSLAGGSRLWRNDGTMAVILVTDDEFKFIADELIQEM
ncbi:unnamed protein product [Caenorhabditis brenneri]